MKSYKKIRRLIKKSEDILEIVLPENIYRGLLESYFPNNHHEPSERKQRKDLRYLSKVLKVKI